MIEAILDDFDLNKIVESGQCFRAKQNEDGTFFFISGERTVTIQKINEIGYRFIIHSLVDWAYWKNYFNLHRNYQKIRESIPPTDKFLVASAEFGKGIRILRQQPFETLISFICSQRKSIPAIKECVENLCEKFGHKIDNENYSFPTIEELSRATMEDLLACKLGYRAKYVFKTVEKLQENPQLLKDFYTLSDEDLLNALQSFYGVGIKVANCVALFAYGRTSLAPIDTWISKIMETYYNGKNPFPAYKENAGIMQQYAFFYALNHKEMF